jgi:hypothetical protein
MVTKLFCPECSNPLDDFIGVLNCGQCRTRLIRNKDDDDQGSQPRILVESKPLIDRNPRMDQGTRSYEIDIVNGVPFYACVQCHKPFPVSQCRTTKQVRLLVPDGLGSKMGGTITDHVLRKGSRLVGWKDRRTLYETRNGVTIARTTALPIIIQGPVCPLCS